jgi:hypothetical protein
MDIQKWVIENLPRNGTVIEAGTYEGSDTLFFSDYFNYGKVYGFEPVKSLYNQTMQKVGNRPNVRVFNMALSDTTGTSKIFVSDINGEVSASSSLMKPKDHLWYHPTITFKTEEDVNTINFDEWLSTRPEIGIIDLLWLDLQGSEPQVLRASPNIMKKTRYLFTEVSNIETYEGVEKYEDFKTYLSGIGFEVMSEEMWPDMGNVLLKNNNFKN